MYYSVGNCYVSTSLLDPALRAGGSEAAHKSAHIPGQFLSTVDPYTRCSIGFSLHLATCNVSLFRSGTSTCSSPLPRKILRAARFLDGFEQFGYQSTDKKKRGRLADDNSSKSLLKEPHESMYNYISPWHTQILLCDGTEFSKCSFAAITGGHNM